LELCSPLFAFTSFNGAISIKSSSSFDKSNPCYLFPFLEEPSYYETNGSEVVHAVITILVSLTHHIRDGTIVVIKTGSVCSIEVLLDFFNGDPFFNLSTMRDLNFSLCKFVEALSLHMRSPHIHDQNKIYVKGLYAFIPKVVSSFNLRSPTQFGQEDPYLDGHKHLPMYRYWKHDY
jgi:hypothetical protein